MIIYIITTLIGLILGFGISFALYIIKKNTAFKEITQTEAIAKDIIEKAKRESKI